MVIYSLLLTTKYFFKFTTNLGHISYMRYSELLQVFFAP